MFRSFLKPVKKFHKSYLPGIVTGSANDDPSSVSTYSVVGATTGFQQLWLLFISTPLIIAVQSMSARIGDVTKKGLVVLIKEIFGRKAALAATITLVLANILTLIADIVGMAAGFQLLTGESYIYFIIPLMVFVWYIIVFDNYKKIAAYFFWFSGILLAYVISSFIVGPDWRRIILETFIPKIEFNLTYAVVALGLLGTTFSPYAFFWQTEEEIEEKRDSKDLKKSNRAVILGFIYSNLIAFFIIIASANAILDNNLSGLTVKEIAQALAPIAGGWAPKIFGLGLIGSGLLAIPILTATSAYAIAEYFQWPQGLNQKPKKAKGFYLVITAGFVLCLATLLFRLNPIKIIVYSQMIVGIITPFIIFLIIKIARNKKVMGKYCCGFWSFFGGYLTIAIIILADILFLYFLFSAS